MTVKEEIAKNILFYRKKSGYTQKEFAELLGVKNSTVSNWENGQNSLDVEMLFKACEIFGVTVNEMYGKYANTEEYTPHEKSLVNAYRANPSMQEAVDKLLGVPSESKNSIGADIAAEVRAEASNPIKSR